MLAHERKALSQARLEHAIECLSAARNLLETENYKSAANRSYYAVFHAMRAVLAFDEIDMKHHSGIISEFRRRYIKTGIFETRMSEIISVLFDVRTDSDYDDFFVISKADTAAQIENAAYFVDRIAVYLKSKQKMDETAQRYTVCASGLFFSRCCRRVRSVTFFVVLIVLQICGG